MRKSKNKRIFQDGVNQRADIKQQEIVKAITQVAPCKVNTIELDLCRKELNFEALPNIPQLNISYFTKNTLFARIFELIIDMRFQATAGSAPKEQIELSVKHTGDIRTKYAHFIPLTDCDCAQRLADQLNSVSLILERILHLEALDVKVAYDSVTRDWLISLATGKGSVVWMLFPPLVQLVPFSTMDAIKLIELYQLLVHELKNFH